LSFDRVVFCRGSAGTDIAWYKTGKMFTSPTQAAQLDVPMLSLLLVAAGRLMNQGLMFL